MVEFGNLPLLMLPALVFVSSPRLPPGKGPCGEEWDINYDGLEEKSPLWGNPRSDGISLACMNSVVEGNVRA